MLIAQAGGAAATTGPSEELVLVIVFSAMGLTLFAWLVLRVLFLMTLSRVLQECSPRNRMMEPTQVYLNLIPLFRYAWQFVTVSRVTESVREEFADRGLPRQGDFGSGLGTTFSVLSVCGLVPYVGVLCRIASFIVSIVYWVRMAGLLRTLKESESFGDDEDREARERYYDHEDDRRRDDDRDEEDDRDDDRSSRRRADYDDRDDDDDRPSRRRRED